MEIRRIRKTEAEVVTDLWDEACRAVPDGGPLKERGRRVEELYARSDTELERALIEAAVEWLWRHDVFVIRAEVALDEPGAEVLQALGFEAEATHYASTASADPTMTPDDALAGSAQPIRRPRPNRRNLSPRVPGDVLVQQLLG